MPHHHPIDPVTERIFFFKLQSTGYEARVVPVEHGLPLASQTEYKIINKAKHARWYRRYNVDVKTHTILAREIPTDPASTVQLVEALVPAYAISEFAGDTLVFVPKTRGNSANTSYIYFHVDDQAGMRQWLASRPDGRWRMALGTDKNPNATSTILDITLLVMALCVDDDNTSEAAARDSVEWWMKKMERGEFEFRPCSRCPFPSGLVGYCNYLHWPEQDGNDPALLAREQQLAEMLQSCLRITMQEAKRLNNDPQKINAYLKERKELDEK